MDRACIASLLLVMLLLPCFVYLTTEQAAGYVNFFEWVNRSTRPAFPIGYDVNGSPVKFVVDWRGIRSMGALAIANGSMESLRPQNWTDVETLPDIYYTGEVYGGFDDPTMVYGNRTPGLLYQSPYQMGTMYGRLIGLTTPGGQPVNMAIRCLGYE